MNNLVESPTLCDSCVAPDECVTRCKNQQTTKDQDLDSYRKMAMGLWFDGGSCTGGKPE